MTIPNFEPGFRLIDGSQLNLLVSAINNLAGSQVLLIPVPALSALANSQQFKLAVGPKFTLNSIGFRVGVAATTAAKAATLTAQVNGTSVTGGVVSLTSANATPAGALVAGSAITAGGAGTAGGTVGFVVSGVTAFVEGSGAVELTVSYG